MLDVQDRLIVIVGGGAVATRKARGLLEAGARRIRVVAPAFDERLPSAVQRVAEAYHPAHLDGAQLAFAATDSPAVNDAVVRDCRARNILVGRVDVSDEHLGDFAVPAVLRRGAVTVAVSASGSPALAAALRDRIEQRFDPRWQKLAQAMRELRPMITENARLDTESRRAILHELTSDEAMDILEKGGTQALRDWIMRRCAEKS